MFELFINNIEHFRQQKHMLFEKTIKHVETVRKTSNMFEKLEHVRKCSNKINMFRKKRTVSKNKSLYIKNGFLI